MQMQHRIGTLALALLQTLVLSGPALRAQVFRIDAGARIPVAVNATAGTTVATFTVAGVIAPARGVRVTLDIVHTWTEDLDVTLRSPSGTNVLLVNHRGGVPAFSDFDATTLSDYAATSIGAVPPLAAPPYAGTFRSEALLGAFDGENPNGIWTLTINDTYYGDYGRIYHQGDPAFETRRAPLAGTSIEFPAVPLGGGVPDGWWVSAHYRDDTGAGATPGGLFLHHPTGAAASVPVAGLGGGLTGAASPAGERWGASSIAIMDDFATILYVGLIVTATATSSPPLELHRLTIAGGAVTSDAVLASFGPFPAGNPEISSLSRIPGQPSAVMITVKGSAAGAPALFRCSGAPGNAAPITVGAPPGGVLEACAVRPDGAAIYLAYSNPSSGWIASVPVSGGSATVLAAVPASPTALSVDPVTGRLFVSCGAHPPTYLFVLDPGASLVTPVPAVTGPLGAVGFEAATGEFLVGTIAAATPAFSIRRVNLTGTVTSVATPPPGGWGVPSGIDLNPDPHRFRPRTAGPTFAADWTFPWSGPATGQSGLPIAGNAGFGLSISATPSAFLNGFLAVALLPSPYPGGALGSVPGFPVHLDLNTLAALIPIAGPGSIALPLSLATLPPSAAGATLFLQALFADTGTASFTGGLRVTVL